jgi:hypothetical protein
MISSLITTGSVHHERVQSESANFRFRTLGTVPLGSEGALVKIVLR